MEEADLIFLAYRLRCKLERANINQTQILAIDPQSSNVGYWEGMADAYRDILSILEKEPANA